MSDTDQSLYNIRYNQVTQGMEGFGGGTPSWTPLVLTADGGMNQLTGDVLAGPGGGSQAATLKTVNSNVGSFTTANITVNAKGLITAASTNSAPTFTSIVETDSTRNMVQGWTSGSWVLGAASSLPTANTIMTYTPGSPASMSIGTGGASINLVGNATDGITCLNDLNIFSGKGIEIIDDTAFVRWYDSGGTNYVRLFSPSSISASYDLKLPTAQSVGTKVLQNDGSGNLSWASSSSGHFGQTVFFSTTTLSSFTNTAFQNTNIVATITPTLNTSKVMIQVTAAVLVAATATVKLTLTRDASNICGSEGIAEVWVEAGSRAFQTVCISFLDSPAQTSATVYRLQAKSSTGAVQVGDTNLTQVMILSEILA